MSYTQALIIAANPCITHKNHPKIRDLIFQLMSGLDTIAPYQNIKRIIYTTKDTTIFQKSIIFAG